MPRPKKEDQDKWVEPFLEALADTPIIGVAAKRAKVNRRTVLRRKEKDPEFAARYQEAMDDGLDELEMDLTNLGRGEHKGNVAAVIYHLKIKRYEPTNHQDTPKKLEIVWRRGQPKSAEETE